MDKILTLDQMRGMSIDNITCLYRDGYRIEENLGYPGVYPDENKIIPYSPRGKFGFASDKIIKLESIKNMSIDQIIELYKDGYRIEETLNPTQIKTAQNGITISSGALLLIGLGIFAYIVIKK